jgi:hypothetical protein
VAKMVSNANSQRKRPLTTKSVAIKIRPTSGANSLTMRSNDSIKRMK